MTEPLRFVPISDNYAIIGWHWYCECGRVIEFAGAGEECKCGFVVPDTDPDDWYDEQISKPKHERDWNRL